jgi:hypothetical protein
MPNFDMQFSEEIQELTPVEKLWCETFLRRLDRVGILDFAYQFQEEGDGVSAWTLWLHGEETLSPTLIRFVQRFLVRHRPEQYLAISYAQTCSRPLVGEFGGGMVFITATEAVWWDGAAWLNQQIAAFKQQHV